MFLVNSWQGYFRCGPAVRRGRPYPEVTAAFLPSSLGNTHSFVLVYSTRAPVSVFGTVVRIVKLRSFSWKALHGHTYEPKPTLLRCIRESPLKAALRIFLKRQSHAPDTNPIRCVHSFPPSLHRRYGGHGILTVCPSGPAIAIPLGPTNPSLITIAKETLLFRRAGFSPALRLLVPAFSLRNAPAWVTPLPSSLMRMLSYRSAFPKERASPQFRYCV